MIYALIHVLIDLSFLTAVAKTTTFMLLRSGKTQHAYMHPDVKGKVFRISPLTMMLAVGITYVALITSW